MTYPNGFWSLILKVIMAAWFVLGGLFSRNRKGPPNGGHFIIPLNDRGDGLDGPTLATGTLVLGAPGCGKTKFVGRMFRRAFLRNGYGGLVLTVKVGEAAEWIADIKECGREKDLIHVTKGGLAFDPIAHEMRRGGGGGDTTNIVDILTTLSNVGRPHITSNGDDASRFFRDSSEQAQRAAINLLKGAGEQVCLLNIRSVINSLPEVPIPEDPKDLSPEGTAWFENSYAGKLLLRIAERRQNGQLAEGDWRAAEYAADFLSQEWPALAPETRTSVKQTFSSMVDKLITPPYDLQLCGGKCQYVPEQTYAEGKIILLDIPTTEHGKSAELLQIANKLAFQGAIRRRDINKYPRFVFAWADEFQVFCIPQDGDFQEICREQRGCVWYATQNLQNIAKRLHEHTPGAGTLSLIGNIGNRIFLQNGETQFTNRWAADCFGKTYETIVDGGTNNVHWREDERFRIHPRTFIDLKTPSPDFPFTVGVLYRNGQPWNETGEPYLFHVFSRD